MTEHRKHLKKLLQNYVANCGNTVEQRSLFWAYVCGWVPEPAAPEVFKENGLTFSGNEKSLYYASYRQLRPERSTEHLENNKLNEALSSLAKEVIEDKDKFKNQSILDARINQFLKEVVKPLEDYTVLFAINNLDAKIAETAFWDCSVATYDKEQLSAWGFSMERVFLIGADAFESRNVIAIREQGNNIAEVVKRARIKATRRLRILQHYLKVEFIHDEQLFFSLSKEFAIRRERDRHIVSTGIDHQKSAIEYDYPKFLLEGIQEANADFVRIKNFPAKLQAVIERALHWIGLAVAEVDLDIKISYLSTALETLLTTKADQRKGERIAYRGYLLGMAVNPENYRMPQKVLRVYELRSIVVHGSAISVVSERDYWLMLDYTQSTLKHFIEFVSQHNMKKSSQVFERLLQSKEIIPFVVWLRDHFSDSYSKNIRLALTDDWLSPKK